MLIKTNKYKNVTTTSLNVDMFIVDDWVKCRDGIRTRTEPNSNPNYAAFDRTRTGTRTLRLAICNRTRTNPNPPIGFDKTISK